jgi:hypothetical protein
MAKKSDKDSGKRSKNGSVGTKDIDRYPGFNVDSHLDELRAIHPLGPDIARALKKSGAYRLIEKEFHVNPNKISEVSKLMKERTSPQAAAGVGKLLGNEDESSDEILLATLYEICRYSGSFSKTTGAIIIRETVRALMSLSARYLGKEITTTTVNDLINVVWKSGHDQGFREGEDHCSNSNHGSLLEKAESKGYQRGKAAGETHRNEVVEQATRNAEFEKMKNQQMVPLALAQNLNNRINYNERHLIRLCPYCGEALTHEVMVPVFPVESLPPDKRVRLENLRRKKRQETGEWNDPDPYFRDFPAVWAFKVYPLSGD